MERVHLAGRHRAERRPATPAATHPRGRPRGSAAAGRPPSSLAEDDIEPTGSCALSSGSLRHSVRRSRPARSRGRSYNEIAACPRSRPRRSDAPLPRACSLAENRGKPLSLSERRLASTFGRPTVAEGSSPPRRPSRGAARASRQPPSDGGGPSRASPAPLPIVNPSSRERRARRPQRPCRRSSGRLAERTAPERRVPVPAALPPRQAPQPVGQAVGGSIAVAKVGGLRSARST